MSAHNERTNPAPFPQLHLTSITAQVEAQHPCSGWETAFMRRRPEETPSSNQAKGRVSCSVHKSRWCTMKCWPQSATVTLQCNAQQVSSLLQPHRYDTQLVLAIRCCTNNEEGNFMFHQLLFPAMAHRYSQGWGRGHCGGDPAPHAAWKAPAWGNRASYLIHARLKNVNKKIRSIYPSIQFFEGCYVGHLSNGSCVCTLMSNQLNKFLSPPLCSACCTDASTIAWSDFKRPTGKAFVAHDRHIHKLYVWYLLHRPSLSMCHLLWGIRVIGGQGRSIRFPLCALPWCTSVAFMYNYLPIMESET